MAHNPYLIQWKPEEKKQVKATIQIKVNFFGREDDDDDDESSGTSFAVSCQAQILHTVCNICQLSSDDNDHLDHADEHFLNSTSSVRF